MHRTRSLLAAAVAAGLLAACGGGSVTDEIAEQLAEQQFGGDVEIDSSNGGFTVETEEGTVRADADGNVSIETEDGTFESSTGSELPDDFPDVFLPGGREVQSVVRLDDASQGLSFSVVQIVDGDPTDVLADVVAEYEGQGLSAAMETSGGDGDTFFGSVLFEDVDGVDVSYTIASAGEPGRTQVQVATVPSAG